MVKISTRNFQIKAYCSCLEQTYKDQQIMNLIKKEDWLGSYDGLADAKIQQQILDLGKQAASRIKKEDYPDFNHKKRITSECLDFYTSENLDIEAKSQYKKFNK